MIFHSVQFLVERSTTRNLHPLLPHLVYGPESHDEDLRVPPGMPYTTIVEAIAPIFDLMCRSLLDNATIMAAIRVSCTHAELPCAWPMHG